jgi:hypothetical protein
MKKILFLCSEDNFPVGAFRFIKQVAENETVHVKGLFFTTGGNEQMAGHGFMPVSEPILKRYHDEKILLNKIRERFSIECEAIGIRYSMQINESAWDTGLFIKESRFSDLVVVSEELFCMDEPGTESNYFMEQVLRLSECAVIIIPEEHRIIDRLTVAYDGGKKSMFALKQFVYLFPYFVDYPSDFVYIKNEDKEVIPDGSLLQEYTKAHFDAMFASKLHFDPNKYFSAWMENKKNILLIAGAYSRSFLSNIFHPSFANKLIAKSICPVFISH